jgi:hypothetical protein
MDKIVNCIVKTTRRKKFRLSLLHTMSTSTFFNPNNCALNAQGNLKDVEDIYFYNSEGDDTPIIGSSMVLDIWSPLHLYNKNSSPNFCPISCFSDRKTFFDERIKSLKQIFLMSILGEKLFCAR